MEGNLQSGTSSIINKAMNTLKPRKAFQDRNKTKIEDEIRAAIEELESIRRFFDAAQEPELVDYAIYREKAALVRLSYLIRTAKNK